MISISVIGAGQVGTQFCKAINATKNLHLEQWYNRSKIGPENGLDGVDFCNDLMQLKPADLYIIAVSDSAVEAISNALPFESTGVKGQRRYSGTRAPSLSRYPLRPVVKLKPTVKLKGTER